MKQWQQSHLIITATTVPVALILCWLIYKKTSSSKDRSPKNNKEKLAAKSSKDDTVEDVASVPEDEPSAEQMPPSLLSALPEGETEQENLVTPEVSPSPTSSVVDEMVTPESEDVCNASHSNVVPPAQDTPLLETHSQNTTLDADYDLGVIGSEEPMMQKLLDNGVFEQCLLDTNNEAISQKDSCTKSQDTEEGREDTSKSPMDPCQTEPEFNEMQTPGNEKTETVDEFCKDVATTENESPEEDKPDGDDSEVLSSDSPLSSEDNSHDADDTVCLGEDDSVCEKDVDINANNNNNTKPASSVVETMDVNGSEDSGCECKTEAAREKEPSTNGWHSNSNCESGEEISDDCSTNSKKSSHRPNALPPLDTETSNSNDSIEVFVEFPSERVGLLIGKQGRNIKQLKQDSGADIFVHEAPMREDIQVLQICGTQSEIESCVSRIKRRFTDISLNQFDTKDMVIPSPNSAMSPMNTPPPMMYPVSNISQLRLPDGITVEVIVSAIADVDCVFVQQFTHPTFHALANLERAMLMCYSEPSTPDIPHPVQVGLICAVQQQDLWYRAQIVQVFEESEDVTIRFMDYGGYATVAVKALKQIRADFVTLPFQATECYIDNIAPPKDDKFCEDSVKSLQEMLQDGRFQARVTGYRSDGHPRIHLFKCLPNKVLLINQEMATKGLATWVEPAPYARA